MGRDALLQKQRSTGRPNSNDPWDVPDGSADHSALLCFYYAIFELMLTNVWM